MGDNFLANFWATKKIRSGAGFFSHLEGLIFTLYVIDTGVYESTPIGETFIPDAESDDLEDAEIPSDEDWNDTGDLVQSPFMVNAFLLL